MTSQPVDDFPPEDVVFRLRAKMEDHAYTHMTEGGRGLIAFRVPGDTIDLLRSLEYLSEFLDAESLEDVDKVLIVSDKDYEATSGSVLVPKMETKKKDDERLFGELKEKLRIGSEPVVFTEKNDILELYRTAIRLAGSVNRTDTSVGLDLLKVNLPPEGEMIYLIFEDGFRKLSRVEYERIVDEAMEGLRQGPSLAKDPSHQGLAKQAILLGKPGPERKRIPGKRAPGKKTIATRPVHRDDPKVLLRDISKKLVALGYRKDSVFSRPDVDQIFFVGMSGPDLFVKIMTDDRDLEPFLKVLDHRKDALGILITRNWEPGLEAVSRVRGFIYLDWTRAWKASEVVESVLKEGGR